MHITTTLWFYISLTLINTCTGISSPLRPFISYDHSVQLEANVADLWWTVNNVEQDITFELHVKTIGWIALGISPAGGMKGADIAVGWVDSSGKAYIQDRYAVDKVRPVIDNATQDWFLLKGKEQNGWTAIQFKRSFDSCDPMDVPIKPGTNILIYAYGLTDLDLCQPKVDITYHDTRRGTLIIPLRSYLDQPSGDKFAGLDFFDLSFDNHVVPPTDTTYYCKIFKSPSRFTTKRHAIAHQVLIDPRNVNLLHHLDLFECTSKDEFDLNKLPDGICDEILTGTRMCSSRLATSWAVGSDATTLYPEEAGYAATNSEGTKYFMIKVHYDNPKLTPNLRDSSGIRFYLSNELRQYDLSYILFGTLSSPASLAIPPNAEEFIIDSYCPPEATRNFPVTGINVVSALPHTHLQGYSVWTKLIRNNTAVQYLFNAEAFDFNHQFANKLPTPIKIYPGDAFATRCIYRTTNKNDMTLGGQRTADEMCSNTFAYYPMVDSLSACLSAIDQTSWQARTNITLPIDNSKLQQWLHSLTWNRESIDQWQKFYNEANRLIIFDGGNKTNSTVSTIPKYEDLKVEPCIRKEIQTITSQLCSDASGWLTCQHGLFRFALIFFSLKAILP